MIIEEKPPKNNNSDWWAHRAKKLIEDQKTSWPYLGGNYEKLSESKTRDYDFSEFKIKTQFNPSRIISSSANVNEQAILARECFLCQEKLPSEQKGLKYDKNFIILCNPYPIFEEHFTIVNKRHTEQTLIGHFDDMLNLSRDLGKFYNIFYNGPKCGASAPDHMHFQAGTKNTLPVEDEYGAIKNSSKHFVLKNTKIEIRFVENELRSFIILESKHKGELLYAFKIFIKAMKKIFITNEEPMMNLISSYDSEMWRIIIFPRLKHRPEQFYLSGEKKILISPAAIDMCGLLILPREEDYLKITNEDIEDIFRQTGITKEYFEYLKKKLSEVF